MPTRGSSRKATASSAGSASATGVARVPERPRALGGAVHRGPGRPVGAASWRAPPRRRRPPNRAARHTRYGFWKPASWKIFWASGVQSHFTNASAAAEFFDVLSVAAG